MGRVRILIKLLKRDKGTSPDGIPVELTQVGGEPLVLAVLELLEHILVTESVPNALKGGRLCRLFKGKGDPAKCGSYRGITVIDHLAKIFTMLLGPYVDGPLAAKLQPSQCGCVRGKGTVRLSKFGRAYSEACAAQGRSALLLFIDILKALWPDSARDCVGDPPRSHRCPQTPSRVCPERRCRDTYLRLPQRWRRP